MSPRLRALLITLGTCLLSCLAYLPLFRAGLLAEDHAALLEASGERLPASWLDRPHAERGPLSRLSLATSCSTWGIGPEGTGAAATVLRAENLLLLAGAALGLGAATRRVLLPWTGSEHASAAGWCTALLLVVHPLAVPAVASLEARGELLAVLFSTWALALFLRGRQDRIRWLGALSLVTCLLAGMADDLALGTPLVLAAAELCSSHRYRPLRTRLRTAATTLVVFGLASACEVVLRVGRHGSAGLPGFVREVAALGHAATGEELGRRAIEKLGLLVLPANPFVTELAGLALAGVVFLLAMHPGLAAARSAPRLWGWLLSIWFLAILGSVLLELDVAVSHADVSQARTLLASVTVMAVGLGIATTALSGMRRIAYPCAVALSYAALSHANALPWPAAAREARELRADLLEARERHGSDVRFLVIDPPGAERGVAPIGRAIGVLLHPALEGERGVGEETPIVLGLELDAFLVWVDQPEFQELRARGAAVVFPAARIEPDVPLAAAGARAPRRSLLLPAPQPSQRPLSWRGTLRSPNLDLEALTSGALLVEARGDLQAARGQRVSWRARERSLPDGSWPGYWYEEAGELRAVFDVGSSLAWRLGDRIKRVWFEGGLPSIEEASVSAELPDLGGAQPVAREDGGWSFARPTGALALSAGSRARFVVRLFDLVTRALVEIPAHDGGNGELVAEGADDLVRAWLLRGGGPVVWRFELRVDERILARAQGRRVEGRSDEGAPSPGE